MRSTLALALLPAVSQAINIVSSNDDGWAEINIRSLYSVLSSAGHSVVVSAPAENQSGTGKIPNRRAMHQLTGIGSSDETPSNRTEACEFDSCEANSGPYGSNATDPRLNWVNSYPVTSMKHGIDTLSSEFFSGTVRTTELELLT